MGKNSKLMLHLLVIILLLQALGNQVQVQGSLKSKYAAQ